MSSFPVVEGRKNCRNRPTDQAEQGERRADKKFTGTNVSSFPAIREWIELVPFPDDNGRAPRGAATISSATAAVHARTLWAETTSRCSDGSFRAPQRIPAARRKRGSSGRSAWAGSGEFSVHCECRHGGACLRRALFATRTGPNEKRPPPRCLPTWGDVPVSRGWGTSPYPGKPGSGGRHLEQIARLVANIVQRWRAAR